MAKKTIRKRKPSLKKGFRGVVLTGDDLRRLETAFRLRVDACMENAELAEASRWISTYNRFMSLVRGS